MTEHKEEKKGHTGDDLKFFKVCAVLIVVLLLVIAWKSTVMVKELRGEGVDIAPTPTPSGSGDAAPVDVDIDDDAVKGDADAPVTIIEFSDYECPFCQRFYAQTLPQIEEKYIKTGKVKLVYRDFALSFHPQAEPAAIAAECAGEQGKYYEYHDILFENQRSLSATNYVIWAKELGLNNAKFQSCLKDPKMAAEVRKDFSDGQKAGVTGTPAFFVNGVKLVGAQPFSVFEQAIEAALEE